ncbi:MAG TPA: 4'-phosphopantetheinyl transferase superfamily protein [Candidatus Binatia bacterium]|nr:4'-phosphopantetheinyl transferase superfamily protein [Candidatus Binatia bacterium]
MIWTSAAADLRLGADEIHVWRVDAFNNDADYAYCAALLSKDEQARGEQFKFDRDRRLFTVAHAALRTICATYLRTTPRSIEFANGPYGKPKLASDSRSGLRFNLSHSGELALIAAALQREIGVDIEAVRDFDFDQVAERFFTAREVAALRSLPKPLQRSAFYKCWTSKEAFLKARGTGLSAKLDEVQIICDGDDIRISAFVPGWSLAALSAGEGYIAALAGQGAPVRVQLCQWSSTSTLSQ